MRRRSYPSVDAVVHARARVNRTRPANIRAHRRSGRARSRSPPSPRRDRSSAPFLGCGVAHGLGEFPAVAAQVLKDARALAVLVGPQFLDHARTATARAAERRIDVWHAHLEEVGNDAVAWRNLIATNVGDNDGTVRSDAQLGAVRITDPYPFLESECGLQPRYRGSYVWVHEHRSDGDGRRRTIRQHGGDSNGRRTEGRRDDEYPARAVGRDPA